MDTPCKAIIEAVQLAGGRGALAKHLGISASYLYQIEKGIRPVPPRICRKIEDLTAGKVSRKRLLPREYADYWPELEKV